MKIRFIISIQRKKNIIYITVYLLSQFPVVLYLAKNQGNKYLFHQLWNNRIQMAIIFKLIFFFNGNSDITYPVHVRFSIT